ncbi:amidase family protein [Chachezhania antarctica]|uniref:amidase family protein n=1 Tax=Chachezhania antarctica TaxID=2340860 RepID=UPI000EB3EBEA|nr:amidase family protein [Chachezhania antarctica]
MPPATPMPLAAFRELQQSGGGGAIAAHIADRLTRIADYNTTTQADPARIAELLAAPASGPLAGLPIAVKDNIDLAGFDTTGGSPALQGHRPDADAPPVARLRAAGAALVLKTNLHEFAFGVTSNNALYGPVRNPADPARVAGGSSGGNATAIALGLIPAALGTDTGGSTRIPAAFCGICGFRPSTGRYPDGGVLTISPTRDTIGPMAACVADIALLDALITGEDALPPLLDRPLRLGVASDALSGLSAQTDAAMQRALDRLGAAGITLVPVDTAAIDDGTRQAGDPVAFCEGYASFKDHAAQRAGTDYATLAVAVSSPDVAGIFAALPELAAQTDAAWRAALADQLPHLCADYAALMQHHALDGLLSATVPVPPPLIGEDATLHADGIDLPTFPTVSRNTCRASMLCTPSLSLPAGRDAAGLPFGLMLEGGSGQDRGLLSLALQIETALAPLQEMPQ